MSSGCVGRLRKTGSFKAVAHLLSAAAQTACCTNTMPHMLLEHMSHVFVHLQVFSDVASSPIVRALQLRLLRLLLLDSSSQQRHSLLAELQYLS